jgi:hypothetical protein
MQVICWTFKDVPVLSLIVRQKISHAKTGLKRDAKKKTKPAFFFLRGTKNHELFLIFILFVFLLACGSFFSHP